MTTVPFPSAVMGSVACAIAAATSASTSGSLSWLVASNTTASIPRCVGEYLTTTEPGYSYAFSFAVGNRLRIAVRTVPKSF